MLFDLTPERRRERRVDVSATAVIFLGRVELGRFAVDNLSLNGALLTGEVGAAVGDRVTMMLSLDGHHPIELDARVVRVVRSHGCDQMAVFFEQVSWVSEEALREALSGVRRPGDVSAVADEHVLPTVSELDDWGPPDVPPALAV